MPKARRACPAGNYTCGALVYGNARYCHDHQQAAPRPRVRRYISAVRELRDQFGNADA